MNHNSQNKKEKYKFIEKCPRCGNNEFSVPEYICDKCHWQDPIVKEPKSVCCGAEKEKLCICNDILIPHKHSDGRIVKPFIPTTEGECEHYGECSKMTASGSSMPFGYCKLNPPESSAWVEEEREAFVEFCKSISYQYDEEETTRINELNESFGEYIKGIEKDIREQGRQEERERVVKMIEEIEKDALSVGLTVQVRHIIERLLANLKENE